MGVPELLWDGEPLVYLGETQIEKFALPRRVELLMTITQEDRNRIETALLLAVDELAPCARATGYRPVEVDAEKRTTPAWQLLCRVWRLGKPYGHIARSAVTLSVIDQERREVGMSVKDDPRGGYSSWRGRAPKVPTGRMVRPHTGRTILRPIIAIAR